MIQGSLTNQNLLEAFLIRHGQSKFNEATERFQTNFNDDVHSILARRQFQFDQVLIDSPLTSIGRQQALKARDQNDLKDVQLVFVSPLKRTLETAEIIFGAREVKIIVLPELSQILSKICDISLSVEHKKKQFPKMDFSHLQNKQITWQLDLLPLKDRQIAKKMFRQQSHSDSVVNYLFQLLKENFPNSTQPRPECSERMKNSKNLIRRLSHEQRASKIAIVAHRRVIIQMTKTPSHPEGSTMKNCESKRFLIE